ncbi:hypothetical protein JCM10550A_16830 [Methanogenium cariaci]
MFDPYIINSNKNIIALFKDRDKVLHFVSTDPKGATNIILELYAIVEKQSVLIQQQAKKIE